MTRWPRSRTGLRCAEPLCPTPHLPPDALLEWRERLASAHAGSPQAVARQVAKGGKLTAEHIHLSFGPSDKYIGKQFQGDPNVDEAKLTLAPFSIITWLKQFPQWSITARLMPAAPPPPGVAIRKAAALAEGKDPDKAVTEARAKVTLRAIRSSAACHKLWSAGLLRDCASGSCGARCHTVHRGSCSRSRSCRRRGDQRHTSPTSRLCPAINRSNILPLSLQRDS